MTREDSAEMVEELRQWGTDMTVWECGWLEDIDDVLTTRALTRTEQDKLEQIHGERLPARFQSATRGDDER